MERPKILYKYRNVGDFTEKILTDKTVWLSKPANLNDPFECSIANFTNIAKKNIIKNRELIQVASFFHFGYIFLKENKPFYGMTGRTLKRFLQRLSTKSNKRRYQLINEAIYNYSGMRLSNPNDIIKSWEERLTGIGIFSLSETDTNQLMWAHYGGGSKGIAFGFEATDESKLADERYCVAVNYSDTIPEFNDDMITELSYSSGQERPKLSVSFDDPLLRACVTTKPKVWEYEREWRYIDEKDGLHSFPGKLVEIVFGLRCSHETQKKYVELATRNFDYPIRFYKIVQMENSNQIRRVEFII